MSIRVINALKVEQAKIKADLDLNVFLAGPFIELDEPMPDSNGSNAATRARYYLFEKIKEYLGDPPVLGEHKKLIAAGKVHYGNYANAALTELAAAKKIDCVVILPSSVGSFCEFGLFSIDEKICSKMLVIIDEQYKEPQGYLHLGPAMSVNQLNGFVKYVDYQDKIAMWDCTQDFLENMKHKKLATQTRQE